MRPPIELAQLTSTQESVLTYRQAAQVLGPSRVRTLLRSGRWRSVCRGVLIAHNGPLRYRAMLWVALLAAGKGARLAGLTAAAEAGLRGFRPAAIHLLIPPRRAYANRLERLPPELVPVIEHRTSFLPREHLRHGRPPCTAISRAVVDAAQWAGSDNEARAIVAAACQQRLVAPREIIAVTGSMPRARRRALTLQTARDAAGGAQALSEIDLVRLCRRFGLPAPDLQQRRRDASGRLRYVDAFWRAYGLQVEVDGAHHLDVRHWEADMRRQNDIWLAGERILRFTAWQVRHQSAYVAATIRAALQAKG